MSDAALDLLDHVAGMPLVPFPVEILRCVAELHDQIGRQVFWIGFAALLAPQAEQRCFILSHDDTRIRSTNHALPPVRRMFPTCFLHSILLNYSMCHII